MSWLRIFPASGRPPPPRPSRPCSPGDRTSSASFRRLQCTPDLLPYDVTGVDVFDPDLRSFVFHPGPVFTNVLLADELNRTPPKVQSALLEAMAEGQVTTGEATRLLPEFFFVVATQNPVETEGTYPLPVAQLDRFLMRISPRIPRQGGRAFDTPG